MSPLPTVRPHGLDMDRLAAAKMWACVQAPYLSMALFSMVPVAAPGLGTAATDRYWRLYIDPQALDTWTIPGMGTALLHEIEHLLRAHPARAENAGATFDRQDAMDWNRAADALINGELDLLPGREWPVNQVMPEHIPGTSTSETVEVVWERLRTQRPKPPPSGEGAEGRQQDGERGEDSEGAGGPSDGPPGSPGSPAGQDGPSQPGAGSADSQSQTAGGQGTAGRPAAAMNANCGSAADGIAREWEQAAPGTGAGVADGVDDGDGELLRKAVAEAVRDHARSHPGQAPGNWLSWADGLLEPVVDWRRVLASTVRSSLASIAGRRDYTYSRPSRRSAALPTIVMPAMRAPEPPNVAIVVDTSGSMNGLLPAALSEIEGVLKALGVARTKSRVIACDVRAFKAQKIKRAADVALKGGGGTNMIAGLVAATELRPRPAIVIVLTDGYTPWPKVAPDPAADVIVVLLDTGSPPPPAWARTIDATGSGKRAA